MLPGKTFLIKMKKLIKKFEKIERKKFYLLCLVIFIVCLFVGLILGYAIKEYKIYQLKRYQAKLEKEMEERLSKKLENYQLKIIQEK